MQDDANSIYRLRYDGCDTRRQRAYSGATAGGSAYGIGRRSVRADESMLVIASDSESPSGTRDRRLCSVCCVSRVCVSVTTRACERVRLCLCLYLCLCLCLLSLSLSVRRTV